MSFFQNCFLYITSYSTHFTLTTLVVDSNFFMYSFLILFFLLAVAAVLLLFVRCSLFATAAVLLRLGSSLMSVSKPELPVALLLICVPDRHHAANDEQKQSPPIRHTI